MVRILQWISTLDRPRSVVMAFINEITNVVFELNHNNGANGQYPRKNSSHFIGFFERRLYNSNSIEEATREAKEFARSNPDIAGFARHNETQEVLFYTRKALPLTIDKHNEWTTFTKRIVTATNRVMKNVCVSLVYSMLPVYLKNAIDTLQSKKKMLIGSLGYC